MQILEGNQSTFVDVDDTLILWNPTEEQKAKYGSIYVSPEGYATVLVPHLPNIEQLKKHAERGHTVIVWSAGGWRWAAEAVKFLKLEAYVTLVLEKPIWYYDDKNAEDFMGKPQYLKAQT